MWWQSGVASAIQACQARNSVLVILAEPAQSVTAKSQTSETSAHILSRLSTSSMHRLTFQNPIVLSIVSASQAVCLKFPSEPSNPDFRAFSEFFKLDGTPPNLYFISPTTGQTLVQKGGFVSPQSFLDALVATTKQVSGIELSLPEVKPVEKLKRKPTTSQIVELLTAAEEEDTEPRLEATSHTRSQAQTPPPTPEPIQVSAPSTEKALKLHSPTDPSDQSRLLARLPSGEQARKTFPSTTKFSSIRLWLAEESEIPANCLIISTAFPRHVFDAGENTKMLSELGLVPSETLIVAVRDGAALDAAPTQQTAVAGPASGLRGYVTGALSIIAGFFRSFVQDGPNAASAVPGDAAGSQREAVVGARPRALENRAGRIVRDEEDDENLLSNGNSTQYGWNPQDEEQDRQ